MKTKKTIRMDVDLQVECTGIELSPDKWETIYVKFDVYERDKAKPHAEKIELPRITIREEEDPETGELVQKEINAFHNGHFTAVFERKAARTAVDKFFPDYMDDISSYVRLRSAINATAERIALSLRR